MAFVDVYFSLGSNLGDRQRNILEGLALMDEALGVHYSALSRLIETEPWGEGVSGTFINACVRYRLFKEKDVAAQAMRVLRQCQEIERRLGRTGGVEYAADGKRIYHDRPIDVDILFWGAEHIETEALTVPHPLVGERDFVLLPLRQIAKPALKRAFPDLFD